MKAIVEFLSKITGLSGGEKVELRLLDPNTATMRPYFFKACAGAVEFGLKRADEAHIFFGVAPRKATSSSGKKDDVAKPACVWIDLDRKGRTRLSTLQRKLDLFLLPPSYVVSTGGGLHGYWLLDERAAPEDVEVVLRTLQTFFKSDHVTDCTRVLRLPGTRNHKYKPPRDVKIITNQPLRVFPLEHIKACCGISTPICKVVRTGDMGKYKSRSERDFAAMAEIIRNGGDYQLVQKLFTHYTIGDRYIESGEAYLERTFQSAVEFAAASTPITDEDDEQVEFVTYQDCYYVGDIQISTFTLEPVGILEDSREDSLVCNVRSRGYVWKNRLFPRSAFTRSDALQRFLPILSWQWLGTDRQVRSLLVQLVDVLLKDDTVPKMKATSVIGRHGSLWVTPTSILSANGVSTDELAYVSSGREHPNVSCTYETNDKRYRQLLVDMLEILPKINRPEAIVPALAWLFAAPQKPMLEKQSEVRFPILMVFGTRGSGKTSLVQSVLQRLAGYSTPRSYDCATTKFSMLSLLGSTNAVPISFKEFRTASREGAYVQRMLRLAYDVGYDVRGRSDQTTVTYPLIAPITIDGEDLVSDPAVHERIVAINMRPEDILPGTECYEAYQRAIKLPLTMFCGRYIKFCLEHGDAMMKGWDNYLDRSQSLTRPVMLPARISSNYGVLFYGLRVFQQFLNTYELRMPVETDLFKESISYVFESVTGRTHLAVDDFVSDIINEVAIEGGNKFAWRHEEDDSLLWIHLASAHNWWIERQRHRGLEPLGVHGIKQQIKERRGQYFESPKTKNVGRQSFWMHPIDVKAASEALDTPYPIETTQIVIKGGAK